MVTNFVPEEVGLVKRVLLVVLLLLPLLNSDKSVGKEGKNKHSATRKQKRVPGLPKGYHLYRSVNADFDSDGKKEMAYCAFKISTEQAAGDPFLNPGPVVWVVKKGKVIWRHSCDNDHGNAIEDNVENTGTKTLQTLDVTGDGKPELLFTSFSLGASSGTFTLHVYQWTKGAFRSVIDSSEGILSYSLCGGLITRNAGKGKAVVFITFGHIIGEDEAHADPHRYEAEWYYWRNRKFTKTVRKESKSKGLENALGELGLAE